MGRIKENKAPHVAASWTTDVGLPVDHLSNVWISIADGVGCFALSTALLGRILMLEMVANLCFEGAAATAYSVP